MNDQELTIPTGWEVPQELRGAVPREVQHTTLGRVAFVLSQILFYGAFAFVALMVVLNLTRANDPAAEHVAVWAILFNGIVMLLMGLLLRSLIQRRRDLLERGTPAPGVVIRSSHTKGGFVARYRFLLPDGSIHSGRGRVARRMARGEGVTVLYDTTRLSRNEAYPSRLFRVGT